MDLPDDQPDGGARSPRQLTRNGMGRRGLRPPRRPGETDPQVLRTSSMFHHDRFVATLQATPDVRPALRAVSVHLEAMSYSQHMREQVVRYVAAEGTLAGDLADCKRQLEAVMGELARMGQHKVGSQWH